MKEQRDQRREVEKSRFPNKETKERKRKTRKKAQQRRKKSPSYVAKCRIANLP